MRRPALLITACALALGATLGVAEEQAGDVVTVRLEWEPGNVGSHKARKVETTATPPEGTVTTGEMGTSEFGAIELGTGKSLVIATRVEKDNEHVWVDHDLDGDLTNTPTSGWKRTGSSFDRVETLLVEMPGEPMPLAVETLVHRSSGCKQHFHVTLKVHRRGTIELAGRLRPVAVADTDHDLRFDGAEDRVYLDVNGDGALSTAAGSPEAFAPGSTLAIGDRGYVVRVVDPLGTAVELERTKDAPSITKRPWARGNVPEPGKAVTKSSESLADLTARFASEQDKAYAQRTSTISQIGTLGSEPAFLFLVRIVKDGGEAANLRAAAARALGNPAFADAHAKKVVALTKQRPAAVGAAAVGALHAMGYAERAEVFRSLLDSSEAAIVGAAAKHLAYLDDPAADKALRAAWKSVSQQVARYQLYIGMRALRDGPPIEVMLDGAEDAYVSLRARALEDLFLLGHDGARELALTAVEESGDNIAIGRAALKVLAAAGDETAVTAALGLAVTGGGQLRTDLAKALAFVRTEGAIDALVGALRDKRAPVRAVAAQILGGIPRKSTTAALLKQVKREKDVDAAAAMLEALGDHGDDASVDVLLKASRNKRPELRSAAVRALARIGFGVPRVAAFFLKLLGADRAEDRILAIDAAAASGDATLAPKVLESLTHDRWEVRLAVAEALEGLRVRDSVKPLIDRLAVEETQRVKSAIADALFALTGTNLYDVSSLWKQWWTDHGADFQVPETVPVRPTSDGSTMAGFFGIPIESERVIFVIDQSGSMSAPDHLIAGEGESRNRLEAAVAEVLAAAGRLRDGSRVNVILFHSTIHPWKDSMQKLNGRSRKALRSHLESKKPTGGTNIYDPLEAALGDEGVDTIMLLSDGIPGSGRYVATGDILRAVRRLNQTRRIAIHCVSFGRDSDLLKRLAAENSGKYARR